MLLKRPITAVRHFLATEAAGGYVLIAAAALAIAYLTVNTGMPENRDGGAIPAATDIAFALGVLAVLAGFNRFGVKSLVPYLLVGAFVWYEVLLSGVHATLAGVAVALTIPLGIALGLIIGKPVGVFGAILGLVRTGTVTMPARTNWQQLFGLSVLCGIGFTMSLFIAALAFGEGTPQDAIAKVGILAGTIIAASAGYLLLARTARGTPA